ncbi:Phospholipase DDHD1 [Schistosoma japonicum]|nr:Phospholipase DDHD1 [Schistosoma japonicum]
MHYGLSAYDFRERIIQDCKKRNMEFMKCSSSLLFLFTLPIVTESNFVLRPTNQITYPGSTIQHTCSVMTTPVFIEWYLNTNKIGSCLFQTNTTTNTFGDPKFQVIIGQYTEKLLPMCQLIVANIDFVDTGEYKCKTIHHDSESESASAYILVSYPIRQLELHIDNETSLSVGQRTYIECKARAGKPAPQIRLNLGGLPISEARVVQKVDVEGLFTSSASANIKLTNSHQWQLLTCHVDMQAYRNVNQTFRVIHLTDYIPTE